MEIDFLSILDNIPVLSKDKLREKKLSMQNVMNMHPLLSYDDPLAYQIFLAKRPDLPDDQKGYIIEIIKRLESNSNNVLSMEMDELALKTELVERAKSMEAWNSLKFNSWTDESQQQAKQTRHDN